MSRRALWEGNKYEHWNTECLDLLYVIVLVSYAVMSRPHAKGLYSCKGVFLPFMCLLETPFLGPRLRL